MIQTLFAFEYFRIRFDVIYIIRSIILIFFVKDNAGVDISLLRL